MSARAQAVEKGEQPMHAKQATIKINLTQFQPRYFPCPQPQFAHAQQHGPITHADWRLGIGHVE